MRALWLLPFLFLACGNDPPMEDPPPAVCEAAGACSGMNECGMGASNFKEVVFCTNCPYKPDTHVCEKCACRALPIGEGGNMVANFSIPSSATGAKSFAVTAVYPVMADGSAVTCERLLAADNSFLVGNPKLNTGNSNHIAIPGGSGDPTLTYRVNLFDYPGTNHLLLVRVASETQGKGTIMAKGCTSGITVPTTGTVDVSVEIR